MDRTIERYRVRGDDVREKEERERTQQLRLKMLCDVRCMECEMEATIRGVVRWMVGGMKGGNERCCASYLVTIQSRYVND